MIESAYGSGLFCFDQARRHEILHLLRRVIPWYGGRATERSPTRYREPKGKLHDIVFNCLGTVETADLSTSLSSYQEPHIQEKNITINTPHDQRSYMPQY